MAELDWQKYIRRDSENDVYEARRLGDGYEIRRPGEKQSSIHLPRENFEAIYEPEVQTSERRE